MAVLLAISGDDGAVSDDLRGLRAWLVQEDELRGRVRLKERPPPRGALGPVLEAVEIIDAVANPAAAVLGAALVAWLRSRVNRFRLEVSTTRGAKLVLDARQVKELDPRAVEQLVGRLTRLMAEHEERVVDEEQSSGSIH